MLGLPTKLSQMFKVTIAFPPLWGRWQANLGRQRKLSEPASLPLSLR